MLTSEILCFPAVPTSFRGWRFHWVISSCFRGKRTLEHWCSIAAARWTTSICAPQSCWDLSFLFSFRFYRNIIYSIFAWTICRVSLLLILLWCPVLPWALYDILIYCFWMWMLALVLDGLTLIDQGTFGMACFWLVAYRVLTQFDSIVIAITSEGR